MSSDNYFVSIPGKNNSIELYEASASVEYSLDGPHHQACKNVVKHARFRGSYSNQREMERALSNFYTEEQVECKPVFLHTRATASRKSTP